MGSLLYGGGGDHRQIDPRVYAACMLAWPRIPMIGLLRTTVSRDALFAGRL